MNIRKKILITVLPLLVLGLSLSGAPGTAGAAGRFSGKDDKKVKDYCKKELGKKAGKQELGACYRGYVFGYDRQNKSKCNSTYQGKQKAIQACRDEGYSGGSSNKAGVSSPRQGGGGGGGGSSSPTPTGAGKNCDEKHCDLIALYVNPLINVLSILVGLVVAASLILGGIQYSAAGSDPQKVSAAKSRISNTLMAFLAYAFLFAFLNFLIPGGIF
ncbi:MAG TPA: hypothetical protein VFX84_03455 [Candidatus Saccharimonadales bacterium]|nr:hypothetical protein [Candidatus Saccharimonadales bacterium]